VRHTTARRRRYQSAVTRPLERRHSAGDGYEAGILCVNPEPDVLLSGRITEFLPTNEVKTP